MEPVNGFKIYRMNDCDWYLGRTPADAVAAMRETNGWDADEDDDYLGEGCPVELTEDDLDKRRIRIENGDTHVSRTYRQHLAAEPPTEACMFASTEY